MRWLTRLSFLLVLLLLVSIPAHGRGYAERLLDETATSADVAARAVVSPPGITSISCRINVTTHDEVGTIRARIFMCKMPFGIDGAERCMAETVASANYQVMVSTSTLAAAGEEWLYVGTIDPAGALATIFEQKFKFPPPIVWRVVGDHTNTTATYTVDCQWW